MSRKFLENKLLIATSNQGKVKEIKRYLAHLPVILYDLSQFDIEVPEETGVSFEENSLLKAKYYTQHTGLATLADDSGLEIQDLQGKPGINSARWAGEEANYYVAINKVKEELLQVKTEPSSIAYFTCVLTLYWSDGHYEMSRGKIKGNIVFPPRGVNGFGYDPIFIPAGEERTFAEMTIQEKLSFSHRSLALNQLIKQTFC